MFVVSLLKVGRVIIVIFEYFWYKNTNFTKKV